MRLKEENKKINQELLKGRFGIEKESLRVDARGWLAETEHPAMDTEKISRDFGESQVEFISDAQEDLLKACSQICGLQKKVEKNIIKRESGAEYVWTYSNPPYYRGEEGILIADFSGDVSSKTNYREYLSEKYGKVKMLYSGVHFNYSISESLLEEVNIHWEKNSGQKNADSPWKGNGQIKNEWYLELANRLMNDSWLLVALTAASPVAEPDFLRDIGVPEEEFHMYASFRNSPYGYWNHFDPELSYGSFWNYCDSIQGYIENESICAIQELYYPIRLKPVGDNSLEDLRETGVDHIELRMLDLNPLACSGLEKKDFQFLHLLIGFRMKEMFAGEDTSMSFDSDSMRLNLHKEAALLDFLEQHEECMKYAKDLIVRMKEFYDDFCRAEGSFIPAEYDIDAVLACQMKKLTDKNMRYAALLQERYGRGFAETRMKEMKQR